MPVAKAASKHRARSLSGLKHRSENSPARGQILTVLQRQYRDIAQKTGEICTGPANLQPMLFKPDRLLAPFFPGECGAAGWDVRPIRRRACDTRR